VTVGRSAACEVVSIPFVSK